MRKRRDVSGRAISLWLILIPDIAFNYFLLYGRLPLVTRGLLYSPLIYLSRVGRSITAQVGLFLAAHG